MRLGRGARAALAAGTTLAAFRVPGYRALWLSSAITAFGTTVGVVAIGWITLEISDSAFAVGAVLAARLVPSFLLGIPLGGIVDRYDRRSALVVVGFAGAAPLAILAALAGASELGLAALLVVSVALGVTDTLHGTAAQSYAFDLAGPAGATNAIALANLGGFLLGVIGSIAGGNVLDAAGAAGAFLAAAVSTAAGGVLLLRGRTAMRTAGPARDRSSVRQAVTLLARNRVVAIVAFVVIVAEILGFSAATLFPTFARDVLGSDAGGLGALTAARYLGSVAALLLIARIVVTGRSGRLILLMTAGLGVALVGFALSRSFAVSLALLFVVGVASAGLDALVQSLLQRSVDDSERGSAVGVWYFAIGFGPIGQLALGAAANAFGAPLALGVSGGVLVLIVIALALVHVGRRLDAAGGVIDGAPSSQSMAAS